MDPGDRQASFEGDEGDQFIRDDDVQEIIADDGDAPMEDEDEARDVIEDESTPNDHEVVWEGNFTGLFPNHRKSVFAISTHPSEPLAVSGGEDDLGYIWNVTDGEVIVTLTGHTDSVSSTAFSSDGEMVATGGMDGKVRLWRRVGRDNWKTWEFLTELQGPDEVMWLRWHPKEPKLLAGSNDSTVWLWQLPSGETLQVFAGHTGAVQCGQFTPDGEAIVTGCADGTFILWNPHSPTLVFKLGPANARFQLGGITSLAVNPSSTLVVVGGGSGGVRVVSLSKKDVVGVLDGHKEGESVEAIAFVNLAGGSVAATGVVVTGATDGKACVWDLNTMRLRATLEHKDAITTIISHPSPKGYLIVTGSADKTLRTWDARTGSLVRDHSGHDGAILDAALGLRGSVIVSAGDDGVCLVFPTE